MTRRLLLAGAVALISLAGASHSVQAATAFQAGFRLGIERGYGPERAHCYAGVFARRATVSPRGFWVASADHTFTDELWQRCRISR